MKLIKKDLKIDINTILDRVLREKKEENILFISKFLIGAIKEFPSFIVSEVTKKEFWVGYKDFLLLKKTSYPKITITIEEVREDPKRNKRIKHKDPDIKHISS